MHSTLKCVIRNKLKPLDYSCHPPSRLSLVSHTITYRSPENGDREDGARESAAREDRSQDERSRKDRSWEKRAWEERTWEARTHEARAREARSQGGKAREDRVRDDRVWEDTTREARHQRDRVQEGRNREDRDDWVGAVKNGASENVENRNRHRENFERNKDNDKKKIEEDRKRLRREKAMFEKSQKERKVNNDRKSQDEIEELQMKLQKVNEELNRKETKWALALSKLQEQVKFLERENQQLHEENHKLKLKGVSAKVSSHLVDPTSRRVYSASNSVQGLNSPMSSSKASSNQLFYNSGKALSEVSKSNSVESGMRPESISSASPMHSNNMDPESHLYTHIENDVNRDELEASRLMAFSPAESLESKAAAARMAAPSRTDSVTSGKMTGRPRTSA